VSLSVRKVAQTQPERKNMIKQTI